MEIFIQGIGSIGATALNTRANLDLTLPAPNVYWCKEPNYEGLIAPMQMRRMSKAVRIGIASALQALQDAGVEKPDLISLGTAYGCLADTEFFLKKMIGQSETMLTPTSFIQSTHNTVSGQIALNLSCHGANLTFVHSGLSFEHALDEGMMQLHENPSLKVLAGGIDELTPHTHQIISRFGCLKKEGEGFWDPTKGSIAGEGSNMFLLTTQPDVNTYASIVDINLHIGDMHEQALQVFLDKHKIDLNDIACCLTGKNGDAEMDRQLEELLKNIPSTKQKTFKHYCGEYPTATAFALAMGCTELRKPNALPYVLIYNHYKMKYHSFILLKRYEPIS